MAQTNELLIIPNHMENTIGYLFLIITGIILFYTILSIELQKIRINKLKRVVDMIEAGHKRRLQEENRQDAENKSEKPKQNTVIDNGHGNQYLTRRMRQ